MEITGFHIVRPGFLFFAFLFRWAFIFIFIFGAGSRYAIQVGLLEITM